MKWLRWLRWTLVGIVVCVALAAGGAWWALRQSLPQIEGTARAPSLGEKATIERDTRGIPVITASTRADLAYALGFAHGQDRFFQMDLSRRLAAGELSELFGSVALKQDQRTRRFGFRAVARRVIEAVRSRDSRDWIAITMNAHESLAPANTWVRSLHINSHGIGPVAGHSGESAVPFGWGSAAPARAAHHIRRSGNGDQTE